MKSVTWKFPTYALCAALILAATGLSAHADVAPPAPATTAEAATNAPAATAPAPTKDWSVTTSQDYFSQYVFRGVTILDHNPIWVPSVVATYKNLTAYYYGYYGSGSDTVPHNTTYEEADFAADVHQGLLDDKVTVTAGMYGYIYPDGNSGKDTYEFYGKVALANYFNPYVVLNWDVHAFHGGYGAVGVSHTYDLTEKLGLKDGHTLTITGMAQLGIDFGYNWRGSKDNVTWNDIAWGPTVTYGVTSALSLHAGLQTSIALNSVHALGIGNQYTFNLGAAYAF
jgi:hypothetical protein